MPPSATRVASRFQSATVGHKGTWEFMDQESKEVALGAWVYHLRQALNGRPGTVFLGGRPNPTKVTVDGDARLRLVGFAVPDVGFVEYDPDRRQVRVLSRSGSVLAHENVNVRFDMTTSALKEAGKKLAYHSSLLLSDIKGGEPDRARTREQDQQAEADRAEQERREQADRAVRQKAELAERAVRQKAELAERAKVDRMMANERRWVTSLVQYLGSVPRKHRTLDRGYMGGPYQTSNTTTEQNYVNIVPWLATSGFDAKSFAQALTTLSKPGLNDIIGVLGPREIKGAPIGYSNYRLGVAGDDLTLTYSETIYYN
jgi:hypothetical protein